MEIFELIKNDHRNVQAILSELETTEDTQKIYECFNQLYQEINLHTEVEEQTFYSAIRECQGLDKLIESAQTEHDQTKEILEEIASCSPNSEEFRQKILDLKQIIQHHIQEEEGEVFSQVSKCMNQEQRQQLGSRFAEVKSKLQREAYVAS